MTKMNPLSERQPGDSLSYELNMEDTTGIGERFLESFSSFLQDKKRNAVLEVLQQELPQMAQDENFINRVVTTMGNNIVEEKRFVFLVFNPKLKK